MTQPQMEVYARTAGVVKANGNGKPSPRGLFSIVLGPSHLQVAAGVS